MINIIRRHFPSNKHKWKLYALITFPVMFSSLIYSLNGFIDNFMVGSIRGGVSSLSAANSWTAILFGILAAISMTGSIFFAQYYNSGDLENAKRVQRIRILLSFIMALLFAIMTWILPRAMIILILGNNKNIDPVDYQRIVNLGVQYIRIISVTWILSSISMPISLSLSETGRGKYVLCVAAGGLIMNIIGNYLLIYIYKYGVMGAAISTVLSKLTTFIIYQCIISSKKIKLFINPLTIFEIGKRIFKQYFMRSFLLIFTSFTYILIELRLPLFSRAYPIGSLGVGAGALSVFALTFAVMNIFMTTFSAISANAANFIGKELGLGNLEKAKKNSDELKGFNTFISVILSIIFFSLTFTIPYLSFLASGEVSKNIILENVKYTSWVVCAIYPVWVWLESSKINSLSGGKVNIQTWIDFLFQCLSLLLLLFMTYWVIPKFNLSLVTSFAIFSSFDVFLLIAFEINYHKLKWNVNITKEYGQSEVDVSRDNYKLHISHE